MSPPDCLWTGTWAQQPHQPQHDAECWHQSWDLLDVSPVASSPSPRETQLWCSAQVAPGTFSAVFRWLWPAQEGTHSWHFLADFKAKSIKLSFTHWQKQGKNHEYPHVTDAAKGTTRAFHCCYRGSTPQLVLIQNPLTSDRDSLWTSMGFSSSHREKKSCGLSKTDSAFV